MSQIQEVKESSDIVEIIGSRISLQRSGSYYRGLCPFHSEKSPSFFVDDRIQRYKCFGCGESGDVFNFLEKYDGMTFGEALEDLAKRAGITLKSYTKSPDDLLRTQILEVLNLSKQYFHYLLTQHQAGEKAMEYLKQRGISKESIKVFQLGYALDSWDGLINYLHKKKKYNLEILEKAGLIVAGNRRPYDRFRDRLIFPLRDHRGRVVGFSGRILSGNEKDAKYINSPETVLYHKSKMLFGYSELYQEIRKAEQVVVVEGEFDVISSAQAHVNSIVAIKGSALTSDHAKLLNRTVNKVLLSLDTDSAGVEATKKAIKALKGTDLELRVVVLPEGKDPDDLIKKDPKLWREAIKQAVSAHEFLLSTTLKKYDHTKPEGKRAVMKEALPVLDTIEHAVELEHYSKKLASSLGVSIGSVKEDIASYKEKQNLSKLSGNNSRREANKPDNKTADFDSDTPKNEYSPKVLTKIKVETFLLFILLHFKESQIPNLADQLKDINFDLSGANQIVKAINLYEQDFQNQEFTLKKFVLSLPEDLQKVLFDIYSDRKNLALKDSLDFGLEWKNALKKLQESEIAQKIDKITAELSLLDDKEDKTPEELERQDELLREIVQLKKRA
jgi:DNA primase